MTLFSLYEFAKLIAVIRILIKIVVKLERDCSSISFNTTDLTTQLPDNV